MRGEPQTLVVLNQMLASLRSRSDSSQLDTFKEPLLKVITRSKPGRSVEHSLRFSLGASAGAWPPDR